LIVKFLGTHSAESKKTRLASILIDGVLAVDAGSFVSELSFDDQSKIKSILLTHGHYDHIRGIPAFAFNQSKRVTRIFSQPQTLDILTSHLMDGIIYPKFGDGDNFLERHVLDLIPIEPFKTMDIEGYQVTALPVIHPLDSIGFEISAGKGKTVFYSGDTGGGLSSIWEYTTPDVLLIDVTFPNQFRKMAEESGHLCPNMLKEELIQFKKINGYLPQIYLIHMSPAFEMVIRAETTSIARDMEFSFQMASEGDEIHL